MNDTDPAVVSPKRLASAAIARAHPVCAFDRSIFVIGHMRCGSTALSNILCSRPEISGYGEAHIAYRDRSALGQLALNLIRRKAWKSGASHLFDKILHSRYDSRAPEGFYGARAIFLFREPTATVESIVRLFKTVDSGEYATHGSAADYYLDRLRDIERLWTRFPPARRIALTHEMLTADTASQLARLSGFLELSPPLANAYLPNPASLRPGAGDPLRSHQVTRIVPRHSSVADRAPEAVAPPVAAVLAATYANAVRTMIGAPSDDQENVR